MIRLRASARDRRRYRAACVGWLFVLFVIVVIGIALAVALNVR